VSIAIPPAPIQEDHVPQADSIDSPRHGGDPNGSRIRIAPVTWEPAEELTLSEWAEHGRRLGAVGRSIAWWIGDWLRYGNTRYGERYPRAARITGYDVQSLMNMAWVASRFEPRRRREALSWSHHAELAALEPGDQERWLDRSQAERLSVRCLRGELRMHRRADAPSAPREAPNRRCPTCGSVVSDRAAERLDQDQVSAP
jgi:hypothetical protein